MNWDDLRFFLALAREGTYSRAGALLQVNHTTVARRLQSLQDDLDVRLFERTPDGFVLTRAGEDMLATAENVEVRLHALDLTLTGRDSRLVGPLRITTIDALAAHFAPDLAQFARRYPEIDLDISVNNSLRNLSKREADVAIRAISAPEEHLVGRRVAHAEYALYAASTLVAEHPANTPPRDYPWIGWDLRFRPPITLAWMRTHAPNAGHAARVDTLPVMRDLVRAGLGIAFLPCYLGDAEPLLERLTPILPEFTYPIWLLTHPDLRYTARIRAFMDHMADAFEAQRDAFSGNIS